MVGVEGEVIEVEEEVVARVDGPDVDTVAVVEPAVVAVLV